MIHIFGYIILIYAIRSKSFIYKLLLFPSFLTIQVVKSTFKSEKYFDMMLTLSETILKFYLTRAEIETHYYSSDTTRLFRE